MIPITTLHIVLDNARGFPGGHDCIEWATAMMMEGHDGKNLATLAGMRHDSDFDPFEMTVLRSRALREVGAPELTVVEAMRAYLSETFQGALEGRYDIIDALREADLDTRLLPELEDLTILLTAYDLVQDEGGEYLTDIPGIMDDIRRKASEFVRANPWP